MNYPTLFSPMKIGQITIKNRYIMKAANMVLGIRMDGKKDILGVWIGENESGKFWLTVLGDLRNRGVQDIYVFCVDGLNGFREAIRAVYPAQLQRCVIHQIRSSTRYVSYKDIKPLMADLKSVYQTINEHWTVSCRNWDFVDACPIYQHLPIFPIPIVFKGSCPDQPPYQRLIELFQVFWGDFLKKIIDAAPMRQFH